MYGSIDNKRSNRIVYDILEGQLRIGLRVGALQLYGQIHSEGTVQWTPAIGVRSTVLPTIAGKFKFELSTHISAVEYRYCLNLNMTNPLADPVQTLSPSCQIQLVMRDTALPTGSAGELKFNRHVTRAITNYISKTIL